MGSDDVDGILHRRSWTPRLNDCGVPSELLSEVFHDRIYTVSNKGRLELRLKVGRIGMRSSEVDTSTMKEAFVSVPKQVVFAMRVPEYLICLLSGLPNPDSSIRRGPSGRCHYKVRERREYIRDRTNTLLHATLQVLAVKMPARRGVVGVLSKAIQVRFHVAVTFP